MVYSVYIIKLTRAAMDSPRFAKANPNYDPRKPCVYVGSTALTPEQRYCNHLHKPTGSKWVKEFHDGLHAGLTSKQPKLPTRREAEFAEFVVAMRLRGRGYGVWTNLPHVPAFYKETNFEAVTWPDMPNQFAIITAYATTGETWTDKQNTIADRKLKNTLRTKSDWLPRITGFSPSSGHKEPGWAAELDFDVACNIGLHFKQDAIYFVKNDKLFLSYCDARRALVPVGKFSERLHLAPQSLPQEVFNPYT